MEEVQSLVFDMGSGMTKIGFAGDDAPRSVFPTVVGRPKYPKCMTIQYKDKYLGDAAMRSRGVINLNYPMRKGMIRDEEDMIEIWEEAYRDLRVESSQHPLLTTEHMNRPMRNSEMIIQNMFERFNVPSGYIAVPGVLSVYSSGRCSAIVLDSGHGITQTFPVYDGYCPKNGVLQLEFGGCDITDYLSKLLRHESAYSFDSTAEWEIVRDIKEKHCFVSEDDYRQQIYDYKKKGNKMDYQLPDGQVIKLGRALFDAPEAMFKPSIMGIEGAGVVELLKNANDKLDIDTRKDFAANIVLSGGNTFFPGFGKRLENELCRRDNGCSFHRLRVRVLEPPERKYSVWIGGSILASLSSFQNMWISKEEYEEEGPSIVHKRCF